MKPLLYQGDLIDFQHFGNLVMRWVGHVSTQMIEQTYGHLLRTYQEQEMKQFSFFHPANVSKLEENGDQSIGNS